MRDGVPDELLDDERVAAAGAVDHRRHVGAGVRARGCRAASRPRPPVRAASRRSSSPSRSRASSWRSPSRLEPGRCLVGAVGEDEEDRRVLGRPSQVADQRVAGRVGPVQVLEDQHEPGPGRPRPEIARGGLEQGAAVERCALACGRRQLGEQQCRGTPRPADRRGPGCPRRRGARRAGRPGARRTAARPRAGSSGPRGPIVRARARRRRASSRGASCRGRPRRRRRPPARRWRSRREARRGGRAPLTRPMIVAERRSPGRPSAHRCLPRPGGAGIRTGALSAGSCAGRRRARKTRPARARLTGRVITS